MTKDRSLKWGSINEIDRRLKPGSDAWKARHSTPIQHLSAYRRLHDLADHDQVRDLVDAPVSKKLAEIKRLENK